MEAATIQQLAQGAAALGVPQPEATLARLSAYADLLLDWNRRINLTGARDERTLVDRHLLDSLAVLRALPEGPLALVDVGSGAGLPGLVLAIARADLRVTLVESIQKKAAFLRTAVAALGPPAEVFADRMEKLPPGRFDVAVARAVYPPAEWLRHGARLVQPGGTVIVMVAREPPPPEAPADLLLPAELAYELPGGVPRRLHIYRKRQRST